MRIWAPIIVCAVILAGAVGAGEAARRDPIPKGRPSRSDICGECHRDIYRMWRGSAHAQSLEDPVFLDAYRETDRREGATVSGICLRCHAPAAGLIRDTGLDQKVSWEGVSCDICHGIAKVEVSGKGAVATYDVGMVKRGPIRDAASMAHEVEYSDLHTTALVCAPCHEYTSPTGTPIMTTYSEWEASAAAKDGKICQDCHMSKTRADVVDPRVARVPDAQVNLHEVPGGHSMTQLNKALSVTMRPTRDENGLNIEVGLKNTGAGHSVPTGMPGRKVVMDLTVRMSDGKSYDEQRVYGESFADSSGAPVTSDSGYFAHGATLAADNRIVSGEQRLETFQFPMTKSMTAYVSLKLHYEHSPTGTKENRTWITFYSADRTVGPESVSKP